MRFTAFILAIIILALSCLPCADGGHDAKAEKEHATIAHTDSQEDSEDHKDDCSPFCHCTCCAGFITNQFIGYSKSIMLPAAKHVTAFLPSNINEISLPVWQPPQLNA